MRIEPHAAKAVNDRPGLIRGERGESSLGYAMLLGLLLGVVLVGAAYLGPSDEGASELSFAGATRSQSASIDASGPPRVAPLAEPRLWIQLGAIVVAFSLYYALVRRQNREIQDDFDLLDVRIGTQEEVEAKLLVKRQEILVALSKSHESLAGGQLSVRHLMTTHLFTVTPRTTLEETRRTMADNNLRHLLVCQDERLLGVISDRDLAKRGRCAADVMTRKPVTVESETPLSPAVTMMMRKRISCLPVVEGEKLVGLFTTTDLIMTLQCAFQLLQNASEHLPAATASPRREAARSVQAVSKA